MFRHFRRFTTTFVTAAALLALLAVPASAQEEGVAATQVVLDNIFIFIAAVLVLFMQAGFALVEAGFTQSKNAANIMMKNLMDKKGVASIEDLRELAIDAEVRMIACQMTMDLFEYSLDDMIEGPELGGAATYIECATQADINLFI